MGGCHPNLPTPRTKKTDGQQGEQLPGAHGKAQPPTLVLQLHHTLWGWWLSSGVAGEWPRGEGAGQQWAQARRERGRRRRPVAQGAQSKKRKEHGRECLALGKALDGDITAGLRTQGRGKPAKVGGEFPGNPPAIAEEGQGYRTVFHVFSKPFQNKKWPPLNPLILPL